MQLTISVFELSVFYITSNIPNAEASGSLGEEKVRLTVFGDKPNTFSWVDLPFTEVAELCFDDHMLIKY